MCFVPQPVIGLFAILTEPLLSPWMMMGEEGEKPILQRKERYHAACVAACDKAIYSASVEDRDTTCCFLEDQEIAPSARKKQYAPMDF